MGLNLSEVESQTLIQELIRRRVVRAIWDYDAKVYQIRAEGLEHLYAHDEVMCGDCHQEYTCYCHPRSLCPGEPVE